MREKIPTKRILIFLLKGTILSILVFFSVSFLTFLFDLDTFNPRAVSIPNRDIDAGFPFTYYTEFQFLDNTFPSTSANPLYLLFDCILTWIFIALPYLISKIRAERKSHVKPSTDILDQK